MVLVPVDFPVDESNLIIKFHLKMNYNFFLLESLPMLSIYYHCFEDTDMRLMKMSLIYDPKIIFKCE